MSLGRQCGTDTPYAERRGESVQWSTPFLAARFFQPRLLQCLVFIEDGAQGREPRLRRSSQTSMVYVVGVQ